MKYIITILLTLLSLSGLGQTFTYSGYIYSANGNSINVPIKAYKRTTTTTTTGTTSVRIFRTHAGNGSTNQYAQYPSTRVEMDKLFNTAYSNTTLWWSGSMAASSSLNFWQYTTLTAAGASVPNNGDYYSTEVTFTIYAKETGTYTFGLTSDDGGDLYLSGYGSVIEWYGGKGMGGYVYGNVSLTAGNQYTFIARMQEYGGGDGLYVYWKRPSQSSYSLQTDEIGIATTTTSAWALDYTAYTNSSGYYSISRPTAANAEWYIQIGVPSTDPSPSSTDAINCASLVAGKVVKNGLHYYMYDVNGDGKITISDAYYIVGKQYGLLPNWLTSYTTKLFTTTEYNTIKAATTDLKTTYTGVSSVTISSPINGGSANYYLIAPGYSSNVTY
jgi:hypothetical protein